MDADTMMNIEYAQTEPSKRCGRHFRTTSNGVHYLLGWDSWVVVFGFSRTSNGPLKAASTYTWKRQKIRGSLGKSLIPLRDGREDAVFLVILVVL
jgi:hypothetical protein